MNDQDKKEFEQIMLGVGEVYGKDITKPLLRIYFAALQRFSIEQVADAATAHVSGTDKGASFFPKPGDLIRKLEGSTEDAQRTLDDKAELAWESIYAAIGRIGPYGRLKLEDKQALAVVQALGGWPNLCSKTEQELVWVKKEFVAAYETYERTPLDALPSNLPGLPQIKQHKVQQGSHLNNLLAEAQRRSAPEKALPPVQPANRERATEGINDLRNAVWQKPKLDTQSESAPVSADEIAQAIADCEARKQERQARIIDQVKGEVDEL